MFEARISSLPFFSPSLFPFFVSVGGVGCERVKRQRRGGEERERRKEINCLIVSPVTHNSIMGTFVMPL